MTSFAELQRALATVLTSPLTTRENEAAHDLVRRHVVGSVELGAEERLEIYRQQFWLRHSGCLVDDYPGLAGVVGHRHWPRFVEEYVAWARGDSWTLRDLGEKLVHYVEQGATWLSHHALCCDMAQLETAYVQVFDAPDAPPLRDSALGHMQPQQWVTARFVLSPALRLLSLQYPVDELRQRLRGASAGEVVAFPEARPARVVLYRAPDRRLYQREVEAEEWHVLRHLQAGVTLVQAFEKTASGTGAAPEVLVNRAGDWFAHWSRLQWVVDIRASE